MLRLPVVENEAGVGASDCEEGEERISPELPIATPRRGT